MTKYLTPEVRAARGALLRELCTPLLNEVVTGFLSQTPKIYGGDLEQINLQVL